MYFYTDASLFYIEIQFEKAGDLYLADVTTELAGCRLKKQLQVVYLIRS